MDFLEIRRKAKERAASRAPAVAPPAAPSIAAAPAVSLTFSGPAADCEPSLSALAAEGLSFTRLPDEAPPDVEPGEGSKPEERLPPAPRWPVMVDGGPLVEALREELGAERLAPAAAPTASAPAAAPAPPAASAAAPSAPDPTCAPAPTSAPLRAVPSEPDPLADFFYDEAEIAPGLEGLRVGAAPMPAVQAEAREYLTFLLGSEEYAVEIERVREVLKAPAVTEVPRAPAHVLGVIMVRGEVIAVLDPRRRLGLPSASARVGRVLVCDAGEGAIGLLVDTVSQVVRLRPSEVEPRPQGIGGAAAEYIAGIGRDHDRMVILLDLGAILRGAPAKEALA